MSKINDGMPIGMSLRDWFAGQAMVGLILDAARTDRGVGARVTAEWSYEHADAMLAARGAAPSEAINAELLAALEEMYQAYKDMQDGDGETPPEIIRARAAIAKAKGEQ